MNPVSQEHLGEGNSSDDRRVKLELREEITVLRP